MKRTLIYIWAIWLASAGAVDSVDAQNGSVWLVPTAAGVPDFGGCDPYTLFLPGVIGHVEFWVVARPAGATANGISGFQGYISGLENIPPSWRATTSSPSGGALSGDFLAPVAGKRQGSLVLPSCQADPLVPLLSITLVAELATDDIPSYTWVEAIGADPNDDPNFDCPLLLLCDGPTPTRVCVSSERMAINAAQPICPPSAVDPKTWTGVKNLYR